MKYIKSFTYFILASIIFPLAVTAQEINGDTIRLNENIPNLLKFPENVKSVELLCNKEDYMVQFDPEDTKVKIKAASSNSNSGCHVIITEGSRTHQFILFYESGPISEVYFDYSTKEKLKVRVDFLEFRKKKPQTIATQSQPTDLGGTTMTNINTDATPQPEGPSLLSPDDPSNMVMGPVTVKRAEFEKRVNNKLTLLGKDMTILVDKNNPMTERTKTVDAAMNLFNNDTTRRVQVSNSLGQRFMHPIKVYLNKLKLLNYEKPNVEIGNIQFISDVKLQPDGTYKGYVKFIQIFTGTRGDKKPYVDKTEKVVEITMKIWDEIKDGIEQKQWDVYLGNILVQDTQIK